MCCLEKIIMSESQERSAALRDLVEKWRATARTHGRYVTHRGKNDAVAIAHQSKSGRLSRCADELEAILLREAAASLSPQPAPAQGNAEEALLWAESAGQRYEISQMSSLKEDIRASYERRAKHDMAKARALLGLPPSSGGTPVSQPAPAPQKGE
jgi:hypothetical protein